MNMPPDDMSVALNRARALCELRRFQEAAGLLRQAIASDPQNPEALSLLASAEVNAGNYEAALEAAESGLTVAPEAEWPHRLASIALRHLGRTEQSTHHARAAVRVAPNGWQAHVTLAWSLADNSDLPAAREAAQRAVELAPNRAETHITAGVLAVRAKRRSEAEVSFRQALSIDPQSSVAHNELARTRMGGRHHTNPTGLADAATGFATSVRADPRAEHGRDNLELVLRVFLAKASYFIFIDAYLIARIGSSSSQPVARLLPILLLAIPLGYAWRFIARLSTDLREYLLRLLTQDRKIGLAVSLDALAVACLTAAAVVPETARSGLAGGAALSALIGRLILWSQVEHSSRAARGLQPRHTIGTPVMTLLSALLGLTAIIMLFAAMSSSVGVAGAVVALPCAAGCAATVRIIKQRRSID